jgi:hypothetical protein
MACLFLVVFACLFYFIHNFNIRFKFDVWRWNLLLKGERKLLKRVCELPSDLASAYLDDLKATAEERLALFESFAIKRSASS